MVIYTFYNRTNTHVAEYLFVQVLIKKENQMKLLSFVALKGGVGKTTDGLCTGQGFAKKGKRVLFVDFDHQCNLSHYYDVYKDSGTVANIFTKSGEVEIVNVAPNIDLIPGSMRLDEAERQLETDPNKNMVLYDWLDLNVEKMNLIEYDYIIFDCRPDFGIATKNAIAVSHVLFSPIIPSDFAYDSKVNLEVRLEAYRKEEIVRPSRESLITAKLYFLPNMIKHNTNKSTELLEALDKDDNVISYIPQKELLNKATKDNTIMDMMEDSVTYSKHKDFFKALNKSIDEMQAIVDAA